ncbi:leucyl/phenylalanyl-tRNA--protein transferase [Ectothiorhodospiraceae bacterium WFHF3C12]|nr:leucyl/phenylalanyl-tRNA--protein transferase [Ectothiorhodospiraceae bacterium WFHF3C12]
MIPVLAMAPDDEDTPFPPPERALDYPNGLIAVGGALSVRRLRMAYESGIFPWFSPGQPPLWWTPDPRAVLFPGQMHIPRSLRKVLRRQAYRVTLDAAFPRVIAECADLRADAEGTWITEEMRAAYITLHEHGLAHSVEVWMDGSLAGGLYGVALGKAFFGESMFSRRTDASKIALAWLSAQLLRWDYELIDCQLPSPHLERLGAREIPREAFLSRLAQALTAATGETAWTIDPELTGALVAGG